MNSAEKRFIEACRRLNVSLGVPVISRVLVKTPRIGGLENGFIVDKLIE